MSYVPFVLILQASELLIILWQDSCLLHFDPLPPYISSPALPDNVEVINRSAAVIPASPVLPEPLPPGKARKNRASVGSYGIPSL